MNLVVLKGRLTNDVERRVTTGGTNVANFTVAVNRIVKREGQPDADFFNCVAFGKTADFISQYFSKGKEILVNGQIQNRNWTDPEGKKRYITEVIVSNAEFCGKKNGDTNATQAEPNNQESSNNPYGGDLDDMDDSDLPF